MFSISECLPLTEIIVFDDIILISRITINMKTSLSISILKKIAGIFLVLLGAVIFVTPFTPGSWIVFIGLEFLGVRIAIWEKIKKLKRNKNEYRI